MKFFPLENGNNNRVVSKHLIAFYSFVVIFSLMNIRPLSQGAFANVPKIQEIRVDGNVFGPTISKLDNSVSIEKELEIRESQVAECSSIPSLLPRGEKVTIPLSNGFLVGDLHGPSDSKNLGPLPLVLVLHGLGDNRYGFNGYYQQTAEELAKCGMIVLRIDFRGHGQSSGSQLDMSLETFTEDANCALNYLKGIENGNCSQISILGLSLGGTVAAIVAARRSDVKNLVVQESPFNLVSTLGRLIGSKEVKRTLTGEKKWLRTGCVRLSSKCLNEFKALNMTKEVSKFKGNVLLVVGGDDKIVLPANGSKWCQAFAKAKTQKAYFQAADHAFLNPNCAYSAISASVDWINKKVRKQTI